MQRSLFTAVTGMMAEQFNTDVISNNLANVNTSGFKKSRVDFQDLLYQTVQLAGSPAGEGTQIPTGIQVGHGVRKVATEKMFTQGSFKQTENPLHMVIQGDGFFQIQMPDGSTSYTRDGSFKLDSDGNVVMSGGNYLVPQLSISEDAVEINVNQEGVVTEQLGDGTTNNVGNIEIVNFVNPAGLKSIGNNLYKETDASGDPNIATPGQDGTGTIQQGFLEMSNVNVAEELVNLITAQRSYEVNSKSIQTSDEMLRTANQLKR